MTNPWFCHLPSQGSVKETRQFSTLPTAEWHPGARNDTEIAARGGKWKWVGKTRSAPFRESTFCFVALILHREQENCVSFWAGACGDTIRSMLFIGKLWIIQRLIRPPTSLSRDWLAWHYDSNKSGMASRTQHREPITPPIPSRDLHRRSRLEYINIWFHLSSGSKLEILLPYWTVTKHNKDYNLNEKRKTNTCYTC